MFDDLRKLSHRFLSITNSSYRRYIIRSINFDTRMSLIVGQRGVGKTTTLVQLLLDRVEGDIFDNRILYIQSDHFKIATMSLYEIAEEFSTLGGKWIAFDEVHKYPNWSNELKSIYDTFPELQIFASGSSALELYKGSHDLSRRAIRHYMNGMSFREYLELIYDIELQTYSLNDLCHTHERIAAEIIAKLSKQDQKVIPLFQQYLKNGYYPFFHELNDEALYKTVLEQNLHTTIESDIAAIFPTLTGNSIKKIKQLLIFIANAVPFTPNWKKIMSALEIGDDRTLKLYFKHLEDAGLIRCLSRASKKFSALESPEKVYLDNPNQIFAISSFDRFKKGTIRETFFLSMVSQQHGICLPKSGDFIVDDMYTFEVGGKNKTFHQISSTKDAYLACDDIEQGAGGKIPLWLFGFLY